MSLPQKAVGSPRYTTISLAKLLALCKGIDIVASKNKEFFSELVISTYKYRCENIPFTRAKFYEILTKN